MKKFIRVLAVVLLFGMILSSCSNSEDASYAEGQLDYMSENSTYFERNISAIEALANSSTNYSLKNAINNQISNFQKEHQKQVKETSELVDVITENSSCGGAWLTILLTSVCFIVIFVVLVATKIIKLN